LAGSLAVESEACQLQTRRPGSGYGLKALRTSLEHPQDHISEILDEVEAVRYLDDIGRRFPYGIGVLAAAVPADHLDSRMLREPPGEGVRAAVRQNANQHVTFEIYQYRSPATSAPEGEVVHTQDLGCPRFSEVTGTDVSRQGISRNHHSQFAEQPRPRLSSKCKRDVGEELIQALGSSSVMSDYPG
jgi:hypothetical protein